mgnify:CR=1 FL=1
MAKGFTASSFAPAALAYLSHELPAHVRHTAVGAMSTAFLIAGIVGQVGAQAIAVALSWEAFFGISGVLLACVLAGSAVFLRGAPPHPGTTRLRDRFVTIARVAAGRSVAWLCAAHVTLFLAFVAFYSGLGNYARGAGLSEQQTILIRAIALPVMLTPLLTAAIARRWGLAPTAILGFLTAAAGAIVTAVGAGAIAGVTAGSVVFVAGIALAASAMISLFAQSAAPDTGAGMALQGLVLFLGASLGPVLASLLPTFLALALTLALILSLAGLCVLLAARPLREA